MDYSECHGYTAQMEKVERSGSNNLCSESLSSVSSNNGGMVYRRGRSDSVLETAIL